MSKYCFKQVTTHMWSGKSLHQLGVLGERGRLMVKIHLGQWGAQRVEMLLLDHLLPCTTIQVSKHK